MSKRDREREIARKTERMIEGNKKRIVLAREAENRSAADRQNGE